MQSKKFSWLSILALLVLAGPALTPALYAEPLKPAKVRVSGLGLWGNREMHVALERMLGKDRGPVLGANAIEDTAFLLHSILNEEGFLSPVIGIRVVQADGRTESYRLDSRLDMSLARGLEGREVYLEVDTGGRSYVEDVRIEGLKVLPQKDGIAFFKPTQPLISTEAGRAYSVSRMRRSADKLRDELRLHGYAQAKVKAERVAGDLLKGGPMTLQVQVEEGPRWVISGVRFEQPVQQGIELKLSDCEGQPWTASLQLDLGERVRQAYYKKGYADVRVRMQPEPAEATAEGRQVVVAIQIEPGPLVRVGEVRFAGNDHTQLSILRDRISVKPGDPLDPVSLEQSRHRLSRLGIFDAVDLRYDPPDGDVRNPVYDLREGPGYEMNLLVGYGSYEQLRGGVEFRQMNLFGHAHQSRLELVQSMKSTRGEYTYSVPELFGEVVDGSARAFGLEREEVAFTRQEFGGNMTLKRRIPWVNSDGSVGYTFESLNSRDSELMTSGTDGTKVIVASIDLGLGCDRRDSMLLPRHGYRWFFRVELADESLGGESDYERFELGCSVHFALGKWQYAHLSFTHGLLTTYGKPDEVVPVNKLFFPGGDGSIRGYNEGEAAPKGLDGLYLGAKTFFLLNLEVEQVLTKSWSGVVFLDTLGTATQLEDYPSSELLYTVGAGIRYQTIVGPIRLEYGHNLNPRPGDPLGTWLLSVGFPF